MDAASIASIINRANQLNPNNVAYWLSRGFAARPENWAELAGQAVVATTSVGATAGFLATAGTVLSFASTAYSVYSVGRIAYGLYGYLYKK